ncbi:MAG: hypothetical protein ABIK62_07275 [candidate division WOR-3 bacterium]
MKRRLTVMVCALPGAILAQVSWIKAADTTGWQWRMHMGVEEFDGRMWVLGGSDGNVSYNDVWYSTDGAEWTRATEHATWCGRWGHAVVVHNGKLWVLGGASTRGATQLLGDVWYSSNGVSWEAATLAAPWGPRGHPEVVSWHDTMWLMGGWLRVDTQLYANDIWCSTDGENWTRVIEAAPWSRRTGHRAVVCDNRVWVTGGYSDRPNNDVWCSSDCRDWSQVVAQAPWPARQYHQALVLDEQIWVIGGFASGGRYQDAWYSSDGSTWVAASNPAPWPARSNHGGVVYNNRLWIMGGYGSGLLRDVWYSTGLGVSEQRERERRNPSPSATIARNVLYLSVSRGSEPCAALCDLTGQEVMRLRTGANDVTCLKPGVYFLHYLSDTASLKSPRTGKIVVTR